MPKQQCLWGGMSEPLWWDGKDKDRPSGSDAGLDGRGKGEGSILEGAQILKGCEEQQ